MNSSISNFIISLIKAYRFILSPWLGMHCRFHPTCSVYAIEAIQQHGVLHGSYLAIKRLGRCHPWHEGGIDPVPDTEGQSGR
ncbi:MAG: membrane protein insertion efficiency factor YidD [Gammaproteobacteria bacterium]|nr:membrane protein insertion efficiency factor YidD [Gammaproteobacteria bacterium]